MTYYTSMDGLNFELQRRWLSACTPSDNGSETTQREFPGGKGDFLELYHEFELYMNKKWHKNVNLGAAVSGDLLLTDHGVEHVKSVIAHAQQILSDVKKLNGYEIYLLLLAIHFHDVGNITGRDAHEQKIADIIDEMGDRLPLDTVEQALIVEIATAHGGVVDKQTRNKDTIRLVEPDTEYDSIPIHPKALAAILRFADEISDDLNRSKFDHIEIPRENEAFHEYSKALRPVSIKGNTIKFNFHIPFELTQRKVGKGSGETFLYDEILDRMSKCMRELEYCRKYSNGLIRLTTADVTISVLEKKPSMQPIESLGDHFRLTLQGYPNMSTSGISDYLETEVNSTNRMKGLKYKDGESLRSAVNTQT